MELALKLVKIQLGISTQTRNEYIEAVLKGTKKELEEIQGLNLDIENPQHLMFLVDYTVWRYNSKDEEVGMPERLHWRLRNLMVHGVK